MSLDANDRMDMRRKLRRACDATLDRAHHMGGLDPGCAASRADSHRSQARAGPAAPGVSYAADSSANRLASRSATHASAQVRRSVRSWPIASAWPSRSWVKERAVRRFASNLARRSSGGRPEASSTHPPNKRSRSQACVDIHWSETETVVRGPVVS
jgi:hypothetical protein